MKKNQRQLSYLFKLWHIVVTKLRIFKFEPYYKVRENK